LTKMSMKLPLPYLAVLEPTIYIVSRYSLYVWFGPL
jgi:hypothetical protein